MKDSDNILNNVESTIVEKLKICADEYFCEMCAYYPIYPVHGHFECPKCYYKTKCCEGAPQNV